MPTGPTPTTSPPSKTVSRPGEVLLLSCYELGRQPLAVASAAAYLERRGLRPSVQDLAVERLDPRRVARARLVAISVPMHTAMRLGLALARQIRHERPDVHICFFGLYAALNAAYLLEGPADSVIGGEFERKLADLAAAVADGTRRSTESVSLERPDFAAPARGGLPPLDHYARFEHQGRTSPAAAVETSRGCLHRCRHCPIPPVYGGRFFVVPREVVLEDVRRLVSAGARHISFADPDFLNGPGHALRITRELHAEHPRITFDFTSKVELILRHVRLLPELRDCGAAFAITAVESLSARVLSILRKDHTPQDVFAALAALDAAGIAMRPTFVPFTPWAGIDDYRRILDWIEREGLAHHVDPVQLSIRLLVPPGSLLERDPEMTPHLGSLRREDFTWDWRHPDPRMDALQREVARIAADGTTRGEGVDVTFRRIRDAASLPGTTLDRARVRKPPPRLTEAWFC